MDTPAVWLILGPDPEVGTTDVAEALIIALRRRGVPAVGVKPIDLDCPHGDDHDLESPDGHRLWAASDRALPPLVVAPYRFSIGPDPVEAATAAGLTLTLRDVLATIEEAARFGGPVVVVGPPKAGTLASDGDAFDLGRAAAARIVTVVDDASADQLDPMSRRATRENLSTLRVARTSAPVEGAVHAPPDLSREQLVERLSVALFDA